MQERKITNELIKNFELYLYDEERSNNTTEKYMRDIRFFREWLKSKSIDKSVVIEYKKELCERYAVRSVNSMLSSVNAFFVFVGWHDLKGAYFRISQRNCQRQNMNGCSMRRRTDEMIGSITSCRLWRAQASECRK